MSARMGPPFPGDQVEYAGVHCTFSYPAFSPLSLVQLHKDVLLINSV